MNVVPLYKLLYDAFKTKAQRTEFRDYIGGLLGESERKNLSLLGTNVLSLSARSLPKKLN